MNITRPLSDGFNISRLALQFDDGAPLRTVPTTNRLQVHANIGFVGSGFLEATWELAGPSGTEMSPVYRPLQSVRHYLTGAEPIVLTSPALPTNVVGRYRVRLRISDPLPGFDIPAVQYFVGQNKG